MCCNKTNIHVVPNMNAPKSGANSQKKRPIRHSINRIRAIVFTNGLISAAKLKRDPSVLMRWGQNFEQELGLTCDELRNKWVGFLCGVLVESRLRAALCKRFIMLAVVLINPLWTVLFRLEAVAHKLEKHARNHPDSFIQRKLTKNVCHPLDMLAYSIRLGDQPLTERSIRSLQWFSQGHWQSLALLLAILASRFAHFETLRTWLRRRFTLIFLLTCLRPELKGATRLLFQVVDGLMRQHLLDPVSAWPSSLRQFKRRLKLLQHVVRKLQRQYRISDKDTLTLIHALYIDWNGRRSVLNEFNKGPTAAYPASAYEVARILKRHHRRMHGNKGAFFSFAGLPIDPKVEQLSKHFSSAFLI